MPKIKRKWQFVALGLFLLLVYTRVVNLSWGLPYPFHPDERNMATAIQSLNCEISNFRDCFNPHFFAYGQLMLYVAYLLVVVSRFVSVIQGSIRYDEAVIALRFISVFASIATALVSFQTIKLLTNRTKSNSLLFVLSFLIFIFSPALIQFAHFGTTESLLMFFYTSLIYVSLQYFRSKISVNYLTAVSGIICGLAIATKISSIVFIFVPLLTVLTDQFPPARWKLAYWDKLKRVVLLIFVTFSVAIVFSPHNLISFSDFINSVAYESDVALGRVGVFYTRQFIDTFPVMFQFEKVFPYALGWPVLLLFLFGFFILPKNKEYNLLRFSFLIYFVVSVFVFVKWARFMAPILPLMLSIAILTLFRLYNYYQNTFKNIKLFFRFSFYVLIFILITPGIAYLSIYRNEDVRFKASRWIYNNVPENSFILSETANVVDVPLLNQNAGKKYNSISFDFYNLDENKMLQKELDSYIKMADYIIVPSRRIFANHTCLLNQNSKKFIHQERCKTLIKRYPKLNRYYEDLFSARLGFLKVAEFSSFPKIALFGKTLVEFSDEFAEETWSVFDHPVIRIYKKENGNNKVFSMTK